MFKILSTKNRLKKIDPTPLIQSRVEQNISSAGNYYAGKNFFHTISIASTGVMFGVVIPQMLNGPLSEYDMNIKDFSSDLALPTLLGSMALAAALELITTNVTKTSFAEMWENLRGAISGDIAMMQRFGYLVSTGLSIFSVGALAALQVYSFGQGAKYSYVKYQLPESKFSAIKTIDKDKTDYIEQIKELKGTRNDVRDKTIDPDRRYGKAAGSKEEITAEKTKLLETQKAYKSWKEIENRKDINFLNGKLKNHVSLMYQSKKSKMLDPIKNRLLSLQSKETDPVKHWLNSASIELNNLKINRDNLESQKEILEKDLISLKNELSKKFPDSFYYIVGALLLLVLATMDYYYNEFLRRANATIYNNRQKDETKEPVQNSNYTLDDILDDASPAEETAVLKSEFDDSEFLNYIADMIEADGKIPSSTALARAWNKSGRDVSSFYARNSKYFEVRQGVGAKPTDTFLQDFNLVEEIAA